MNTRNDIFNIAKEKLLKYFIFTFVCYALPLIAIGLSNYSYLDDTWRRAMGYTGFGHDYSRWGSEILSWLLQGSRHLVDTGLTNYLIVAFLLSFTSLILVTVLSKISFWSLFVSVAIGLNPWSLALFSFKFDSPFMALSLLASVFPFLFWRDKKFVGISFLSLFLMYNTYQASSGIFLVIFLIKIYKELTQGESWQKARKNVLVGIVSFLAPSLVYFLQLKLFPVAPELSQNASVSQNILKQVFVNLHLYLLSILRNSTKAWLAIVIALVILLLINELLKSKTSIGMTLLFLACLLVLGTLFSFGPYLILKGIVPAPRYLYAFPFFGVCLALLLTESLVKVSQVLKAVGLIVTCALTFFMIQFSFLYASVLTNQREALQQQSTQLATSMEQINLEGKNLYFSDNVFSDSVVLKSAQRNYPILKGGYSQLLLSNSDTRQSFINHQAMQNLHQKFPLGETNYLTNGLLSAQMKNITDGQAQKVTENNRWSIYTFENEVYIVAK